MKNRFFIIFSFSMVSAILLSLFFSYYFLNQELKKSLDLQLESMASTILATDLNVNVLKNIDPLDDFVSDLFSEERVDRYIRIYHADTRKLIYGNELGLSISLPLPSGVRLMTVAYGAHNFRVLEIQKGSIILQIAILDDPLLFKLKVLEKNFFFFSLGILLIIGLITFLSWRVLLGYINGIGNDFFEWSRGLSFDLWQTKKITEALKVKLEKKSQQSSKSGFKFFINQMFHFVSKLSEFLQFSQKQYAILAHEFKTPLTIIRTDLEYLRNQIDAKQSKEMDAVIAEIDRLSHLTQNFLEWGQDSAKGTPSGDIYAVDLPKVILNEVEKIKKVKSEQNFKLDLEPTKIFCSPFHAEQLISNIIQNAFLHGPTNQSIQISLKAGLLSVSDQGPGINQQTLQHLGMPFNKGVHSKGSGLGLAWMKTITDMYEWQLSFEKNVATHTVKVKFKV